MEEVKVFPDKQTAALYLTEELGYTYDRHETWGFTSGFDLYDGPEEGQKAALRFYHTKNQWQVVLYETK